MAGEHTGPRVRRHRIAVAAAAGCLALPLLAACTPAEDRVFGVRVVQGHLVVDPGRCPDESMDHVSVTTRLNGTETGTWRADADSTGAKTDQVDTGALAPGWKAQGEPPVLQEGATYSVRVSAARGDQPHTGAFTVDAAALTGLGEDRIVRFSGGKQDGGGTVTLSDYRAQVQKSCH
ncbi:hypothetical protein ACIQBJ_20395 [Kitasatospora sp. NPDC088391]|uniref:hypothetical protein n=1 Tax=Kitasatospora sp. NPDC088391 TaxID=3364074 RepID=UPI00381781FE